MASRTQMRLQQLTGSFSSLKTEAQQYVTPAAAAALTGSDLQDVLGAFGAALNRIHGAASDEPFNATAGHFLNSATTDGADDAGAIKLSAANGGIGIAFNDAKDLWIEGGQTMVVANHDTADAIKLHADAGSSQTITVLNDEGTAAAAIALTATAGGVDIDAAAGKDVAINGGQVILTGLDDTASSISLVTDNGTSETITVQALSSEADGAITLQSPSGGILLDTNAAGKKIHLDSEGSVDIDAVKGLTISNASAADADDMTIEVTGATNSSLHLASSGTAADALTISTSAGGMDITVAGAAAGEDLDITANSSVNITSSENIADSIVITGGGGVDIVTQNDKDLDITSANNVNIDAQGTTSGDGVIVTLGSDTADTIFKVLNNSGQDAFIVNGAKNAQVEGNLTVAGNLDINGTTTTIDSVNLTVQDSIIALGVSGSDEGYSTVGDRGILFPRGTDASAVAGFWWDGSRFQLATSKTGPNSGSFQTVDAYNSLKLNKIEFDDNTNHIAQSGGNLTVSADASLVLDVAANIELNADGGIVEFKDGAVSMGTIQHNSANKTLIVSSSADDSITLEAQSGEVFISDDAGGSSAGISVATANEIKFGHTDQGTHDVGFLNLKDNNFSILSASIGLQIDAGATPGLLRLKNGAQNVGFKAPGTLSNGYDMLFPNPGTPLSATVGKVLKVASQAGSDLTLEFADPNSGLEKAVRVITGSAGIPAGTALSVATADITAGDQVTSLSTAGSQGSTLDVFVNGQLLVSGSETERAAGDRDYVISAAQALKFAFALEEDDVVQVIKR